MNPYEPPRPPKLLPPAEEKDSLAELLTDMAVTYIALLATIAVSYVAYFVIYISWKK